MSEYIKFKVFLTDNQKDKLKSSIKKKESCSLIIQPNSSNFDLYLTKTQVDKLNDAKKRKKGAQIELSKTQLEKTGGFLPLLGLVLKGLATGAASYAGAKAIEKAVGKGSIVPGTKRGRGLKKTKSMPSVTSKSKKK